jgi:ureidoacrylate peracid hydrolase
MNQELKNIGNIAVLVVDIQNDFCHDEGIFAQQGLDVSPAQEVTPRIQSFIDEVRKYDVPVIYSKQIESDEVTPDNLKRQFAHGKLKAVCTPNSWGAELYQLEPAEGEHVLEKHTYDVFSNPQLRKILDERGIDTLVIAGVNTDVCVDTTVRSAFTNGYQVVVPKDLVATMNVDGQEHYLSVFDRFFGDVVESAQVPEYLRGNE